MTLKEIYARISIQSGLTNVNEFADVIPYCFSDAFVDVIKLPKSDIDRTPFYVDEMLPLVIMDSQSLIKSNNVGEYDLSDIDRLSYLANVESAKDSTVKYKYLEIDAFNDVYINNSYVAKENVGYWTRLGKVIRIMNFDNLDPSMVLIIYVLNPNTDDWTVTYDFINAGYGFGFISAVIEVAINKLIDMSKRRV